MSHGIGWIRVISHWIGRLDCLTDSFLIDWAVGLVD